MDKNDIRKGKDIEFSDGVTRRVRPLSIKQLRKFVKIIDKLGSTENAASMSDEDIDTMVDAAAVIFEKVDQNLAADRDAIEDVVDLLTFNDMMNVAMGNASPEE
jgi:hypothetical protein